MSKTKMPAAEAVSTEEQEVAQYELAFHVLPTVAEGEVINIVTKIKELVINAGGEILTEEAPARFDLAYDIVKYIEGRNRKFNSAYFGWIRFTLTPDTLENVSEGVETIPELLRHLLTRLTKVEEENPFYFHESIDRKTVTNIEEEDSEEVETQDTDDSKEAEEDGEDKK